MNLENIKDSYNSHGTHLLWLGFSFLKIVTFGSCLCIYCSKLNEWHIRDVRNLGAYLVHFPIPYRWENGDPERSSDQPKVTQVEGWRTDLNPDQADCFSLSPSLALSPPTPYTCLPCLSVLQPNLKSLSNISIYVFLSMIPTYIFCLFMLLIYLSQ